jgi:hypothetical protein
MARLDSGPDGNCLIDGSAKSESRERFRKFCQLENVCKGMDLTIDWVWGVNPFKSFGQGRLISVKYFRLFS